MTNGKADMTGFDIYCPSCGVKWEEVAEACPSCGALLAEMEGFMVRPPTPWWMRVMAFLLLIFVVGSIVVALLTGNVQKLMLF